MTIRDLGTLRIDVVAETAKAIRDLDNTRLATDKLKKEAQSAVGPVGALGESLDAAGSKAGSTGKKIDDVKKSSGALKKAIEPTASAMSGLASAMGGAGSKAGQLVGALSNMAGVAATSGILGVALTAATFGVGALASKFIDSGEEARAASEEIRKNYVSALEEVKKAADEAEDAIRSVGKAPTENRIQSLREEIAMMGGADRGTIRSHGQLRLPSGATAQEERGPVSEFAAFSRSLQEYSRTAERAERGEAVAVTATNEILKEKQRELRALIKLREAEVKEEARRNKVKSGISSPGKEAEDNRRHVDAIEAIREQWAKVAENIKAAATERERMILLEAKVQGLGAEGGLSGSSFAGMPGGFGSSTSSAWRRREEERRAQEGMIADGRQVSSSIGLSLFSGDFGSALSGVFAVAGKAAGIPIAGQILEAGFALAEKIAEVFKSVFDEASRQLGNLVSGSRSASAFLSAGQSGSQGASVLGGAALSAPLTAPLAPFAAGAGFVGGAASSLVTSTEGFARASASFDAALTKSLEALEPFANNLVMLAPIFQAVGSALTGVLAQMIENGGQEMLFQAAKLAGTALLRASQAVVTFQMSMQYANLVVGAFALATAEATSLLMGGQFGSADRAAEARARFEAAQLAGHDLGELSMQINAAITNLTSLDMERAISLGGKLADSFDQTRETVSDLNSEMMTTVRNMPTWFNVGAASNAAQSPSGPPVVIIVQGVTGGNDIRDLLGIADREMRRRGGSGTLYPARGANNQHRR